MDRAVKLVERESSFQTAVIQLAQALGWKAHHTRPAWTAKGYRTPLQGDAGFCDLILAKAGRPLLVRELKAERGKVSDDQQAWLDVLMANVTYDAGIWKPSDWDLIVHVLGR